MSPDDPRHGTNAGCVAHWRDGGRPCDPCRDAAMRAKKRRQLVALATGEPATVRLGEDAHSIVAGTNRQILSRAVGIRGSQLRVYELDGPDRMVRRSTRDKILTFRRPWTPVGIQRRLRALGLLGWSMQSIADRTGIYMTSLAELRRNEALKFVRVEIAEKILAVWADLSLTVAPDSHSSRETAARAARRGWIPGLAWDDIDDPDEQPVGWEYQAPDRGEILRDLAARGAGVSEACRALSVTRAALQKWCSNHDMSPLYLRLVSRENGMNFAGNQHTEEVA